MYIKVSVSSLVYVIAVAVGSFIAGILFYSGIRVDSNKYLGLSMAAAAVILLVRFLSENTILQEIFHPLDNLFWLLYIAFAYLYFRKVTIRKELTFFSVVHFVPVALFLLLYSHFLACQLLAGTASKSGSVTVSGYPYEFFLSEHFYYQLRSMFLIVYWIIQLRLFIRFRERNTELRTWLILFLCTQMLLLLHFSFTMLSNTGNELLYLNLSAVVIFMAIYLLCHPRILYGLYHRKKLQPATTAEKRMIHVLMRDAASEEKPPQASEIKIEDSLARQLRTLMESKAPYLRIGYSLQDLSVDINIPAYQISAYLNQKMGVSFNDYLNHYRVQHCIERLKKGDSGLLKLEALAFECGFNNRNTFTTAFKKSTGVTPSEYMRMHNKKK